MLRMGPLCKGLLCTGLLCMGLLCTGLGVALACAPSPDQTVPLAIADLPGRVLWAWDRPEDLRFLDPAHDAVAAFEAIVTIDRVQGVRARPRLHPLQVADGMTLIGVVRVETAAGTVLDEATMHDTIEAILAYHRADRTVGLQIDFDARRSERDFYRDLLHELRSRLPASASLSMTALASWCVGDTWLDGLPIFEAVPMLFRMGVDDGNVRSFLAAGQDFRSPICRRSLGLSTDEPWPALPAGRRLFVFHPRSWTAEDVTGLEERLRQHAR